MSIHYSVFSFSPCSLSLHNGRSLFPSPLSPPLSLTLSVYVPLPIAHNLPPRPFLFPSLPQYPSYVYLLPLSTSIFIFRTFCPLFLELSRLTLYICFLSPVSPNLFILLFIFISFSLPQYLLSLYLPFSHSLTLSVSVPLPISHLFLLAPPYPPLFLNIPLPYLLSPSFSSSRASLSTSLHLLPLSRLFNSIHSVILHIFLSISISFISLSSFFQLSHILSHPLHSLTLSSFLPYPHLPLLIVNRLCKQLFP